MSNISAPPGYRKCEVGEGCDNCMHRETLYKDEFTTFVCCKKYPAFGGESGWFCDEWK